MRGALVYVAGPYTQGDKLDNVVTACWVADRIEELGFRAFVPHVQGHFREYISPKTRSWEWWMAWCLAFLERCDVLLWIPGPSEGTPIEALHAKRNGIPVVGSVAELVALLRPSGDEDTDPETAEDAPEESDRDRLLNEADEIARRAHGLRTS